MPMLPSCTTWLFSAICTVAVSTEPLFDSLTRSRECKSIFAASWLFRTTRRAPPEEMSSSLTLSFIEKHSPFFEQGALHPFSFWHLFLWRLAEEPKEKDGPDQIRTGDLHRIEKPSFSEYPPKCRICRGDVIPLDHGPAAFLVQRAVFIPFLLKTARIPSG